MGKTRGEIVDAICAALVQWKRGEYSPYEFYHSVNGQHEDGNEIARALDAGTNEDVIIAVSRCLRSHFHPDDLFLLTLLRDININWIQD